jgi:hypothetical protein
MMGDTVRVVLERSWTVKRIGTLEEVILDNGAVRFKTSIRDDGRDQPFLVRWFNDPTPAADFLEKVESGAFNPQDRKDRR